MKTKLQVMFEAVFLTTSINAGENNTLINALQYQLKVLIPASKIVSIVISQFSLQSLTLCIAVYV
jgi:hypothetical protein